MIFVYKRWEEFCSGLADNNCLSIPACEVSGEVKGYVVLKHDVETNVKRAYNMSKIEHKYGHRGTYYIQAYLLDNDENVKLLCKMQAMGHEISYHYDVMDSNKGDIQGALLEFEKNRKKFVDNGFEITTVCQHGNPIVERNGYNSNRDFFRNNKIQEKYSNISDIMVNFKDKHNTEYNYYSDAGRNFKLIFDPIYNDIIDSADKDIKYANLNELLRTIDFDNGNIISTHPHRWEKCALVYLGKAFLFKCIKIIAKTIAKNRFMKKIMSKYYYIAKKI